MKVGLSLSGGGIRAAAHIGVLKVFEREGITIDYIAGTSAASIIASLHSIGYKAREIEDIFLEYETCKKKVNSMIDIDFLGILSFIKDIVLHKTPSFNGVVKGNKFEAEIARLCAARGAYNIKDAKIPLAIPTVDMHTAQIVMLVSDRTNLVADSDATYNDDVPMAEAIRASASLPIIFKPKQIKQHQLLDGGVRENLPTDILREMGANVVIGVAVGYHGQDEKVSGVLQIAGRTLNIMSFEMARHFVDNTDTMLYPYMSDVGLFDFECVSECIKCGEFCTEESIELIKTIVK